MPSQVALVQEYDNLQHYLLTNRKVDLVLPHIQPTERYWATKRLQVQEMTEGGGVVTVPGPAVGDVIVKSEFNFLLI